MDDEIVKELSWICERYHMTRPDAIELLKLQVLRKNRERSEHD